MMKIKEFGMNKSYARNYLNRIQANKSIEFSAMALSVEHNGYIVIYSYKK